MNKFKSILSHTGVAAIVLAAALLFNKCNSNNQTQEPVILTDTVYMASTTFDSVTVIPEGTIIKPNPIVVHDTVVITKRDTIHERRLLNYYADSSILVHTVIGAKGPIIYAHQESHILKDLIKERLTTTSIINNTKTLVPLPKPRTPAVYLSASTYTEDWYKPVDVTLGVSYQNKKSSIFTVEVSPIQETILFNYKYPLIWRR